MSDTAASVAAGATPVASQGSPTQPIIARAGRYYRNTRYIMAVLTVAMGLWFGYDGFVRWPAENKAYAKMDADLQEIQRRGDSITDLMKEQWHNQPHHTDLDVTLQRTLAFSLPPLGILLLIWAMFNSRGEYRLADEVLDLPGHPPVPLAAIRELDQSAWDRKGIARLSYELPDGQKGTAKLDDFVYDRTPTDQIYDQIKSHLQPPAETPGGTGATAEESTSAPVSPPPAS